MINSSTVQFYICIAKDTIFNFKSNITISDTFIIIFKYAKKTRTSLPCSPVTRKAPGILHIT